MSISGFALSRPESSVRVHMVTTLQQKSQKNTDSMFFRFSLCTLLDNVSQTLVKDELSWTFSRA